MQPSRKVFDQIAALIAADTTTIGEATGCMVHLAVNNFTPSLDLDFTTLTEATFPGYTSITSAVGPQKHYYDAVDGLQTVQIMEPANGWHWTCNANPTAAQTIYGFYVTDTTQTFLMGSALLPTPVTVNKAGQGFDLDDITLKFSANSPK